MSRPLKDIVAELEEFYGKNKLKTLEERSKVIREYEASMAYLLGIMDSYVSEVKYTREQKLSVSIISRITQNLIVHMVYAQELLEHYRICIAFYLMDERYDQNYKYWEEFENRSCKIKDLLDKLDDNNIFCIDNEDEDSYLQNLNVVDSLKGETLSLAKNENTLAISNGANLLKCLYSMIEVMRGDLENLKIQAFWYEDELLDQLYDVNYLLYATEYWPERERNFRPHIVNQHLKNNVSIAELERLRKERVRDFENNSVPGKIWRDYSEDDFKMAFQMKDQKLNEEQWKYFFQNIFELEEYDRWIDELRNPPESEEQKQKRERLLRTNNVFTLQPTKSKKKVDILFLYNYIDTRFVPETKFVYEWYALYYIFKRNGIINTCTIEDFAKQMNDTEWFAHVNKKCKANEINSYRFLDTKAPDFWEKVEAPEGNRASKKALKNIYRRYYLLNDSLDEIYEKQ